MALMRDHLALCAECARRDTAMRRALLLARNLPQVTVSETFGERLRERLRTEGPVSASRASRSGARSVIGILAAAASLLLLVAAEGLWQHDRDPAPHLTPVVVTMESGPPSPQGDPVPGIAASLSSGLPLWPALMLAEEGPLLLVNGEQPSAGYTNER